MNPEEKAKELIEKFRYKSNMPEQCALIAVDEIIRVLHTADTAYDLVNNIYYWQQVKTEIEKL